MKNISAKSYKKLTANYTACSSFSRRLLFSFLFLAIAGSTRAQTLKEKLYGGQIRADTGTVVISGDTSKYVVRENAPITAAPIISSGPGKRQEAAPVVTDNSLPDSLNKLYYSKQKLWKRFLESNVAIITDQANDSRKVKKGTYQVEIEYEIGLNGRVTTRAITIEPNNPFLLDQFTQLMARTPVLSPPVYSDGKPRISVAKQPITVVKK